ncbi:FAD-dependent thymidylate synthase [Paraburkholderia kururiensis]|uniref:FAD-dependent thymidylate synthase n=1 Tax=Paraburkholderia kururiensis TaxID=984307 RepID=UPI0009E00339|nr:FAD-dependent thymidylate synthase [Paraburkholderia kururiensis]
MKLYLIASTQINTGALEFLRDNHLVWHEAKNVTAAQRVIEFAGRICYMAFGPRQSPRSNAQYIRNLISQGHGSVLEHSSATILLSQISRGLSHQLVRHRAGFSYSQLSQQYVSEEEASFAMPMGLERNSEAADRWSETVAQSRATYRSLVDILEKSDVGNHLTTKERLRFIRTAARSVLPEATHTALVMTGNMRAWRNFLHSRGNIPGDYEMTRAAVEVFGLVREVAPACFEDMKIVQGADGQPYVVTDHLIE